MISKPMQDVHSDRISFSVESRGVKLLGLLGRLTTVSERLEHHKPSRRDAVKNVPDITRDWVIAELERIVNFNKGKCMVEQPDGTMRFEARLMEPDDWGAVRAIECDGEGRITDVIPIDQDRARRALARIRAK